MTDKRVRQIVFAALFAALCCVATMAIRIPTPLGGYIHAGDAVVVLAAFLLGPVWGALAAGIGSALADIVSGYVLYAPGTMIVKALVALIAGAMLRGAFIKKQSLRALLAGVVSEAVMVLGYFFYESVILGFGTAAVANIPMNAIQAVAGAAAGTALFAAINKTKYFNQGE